MLLQVLPSYIYRYQNRSCNLVFLEITHPAPLPNDLVFEILGAKLPPPKPSLKIVVVEAHHLSVTLSWDIPSAELTSCANIQRYQIYAYMETSAVPSESLWRKVGHDILASRLPIAGRLSHFALGNRYHFAVRAIDKDARMGPFSQPQTAFFPKSHKALKLRG